ncbi:MAG: aspartate kinase [Fretibacterium sp.]|nr:aspartate kinase [Fretibacterium sp.]
MNPIVAKFGGSSLADAAQIRKVAAIIKADSDRKYIVVSAPGKREDGDIKVTDLLYQCHFLAERGLGFEVPFSSIRGRFSEIVHELGINFDLEGELRAIYERFSAAPDRDYIASRGEYLNAKIISDFLGFDFVEPADNIFFGENGRLDGERTFAGLGERLQDLSYAVIPGFYGAMPDGRVRTFSRGGSDITGSIVARAVNARLYENWTDVSGLLSADPRIVTNPKVIESITYTELRELSYMGASVLHEDAIFPVKTVGIPINIRNTNQPDELGTTITSSLKDDTQARTVTGIAGRKGFSAVIVEKSMMNAEVGFGAGLLQVFAEHGVAFEHCPSGIDTLSLIVNTEHFAASKEAILRDIWREMEPESISVQDGLAMIAVVGQGMVLSRGTAVRVFKALADAEINIRMIDQGPSELNIIVGVDEADFEDAIRAIYRGMESLM